MRSASGVRTAKEKPSDAKGWRARYICRSSRPHPRYPGDHRAAKGRLVKARQRLVLMSNHHTSISLGDQDRGGARTVLQGDCCEQLDQFPERPPRWSPSGTYFSCRNGLSSIRTERIRSLL